MFSMLLSLQRGQVGIARLNREPAASWHGVASVDDHIHHNLLDLSWIHLDLEESRLQLGDYFDIGADQPFKHLFEFDYECIQVDNDRTENLLVGKRKQLTDEISRMFACPEDLANRLPVRIACR
ncbi:hypothetical protein BH10PLA2_BH10PLA2_24640 [soil metagenome]